MSNRQQHLRGFTPLDFEECVTVDEARIWASRNQNRNISKSNIAYLVQYGQIRSINKDGVTLIRLDDLQNYYGRRFSERETDWKKRLGDDLNWNLSFEHLREVDTTKHVHRLHPYKGKFIPQLVEYFLDEHIDEFKSEVFFSPGDVVLDPFAGSGTTMVQAAELGIHSIGIDISNFNSMMIDVKIGQYDLIALQTEIERIRTELSGFCAENFSSEYENELGQELGEFNRRHFPNPEFRRQVKLGEIDEVEYGKRRQSEFSALEDRIMQKYGIRMLQKNSSTFLEKWYCQNIRNEIEYVNGQINLIEDASIKRVLQLILSRTVRSCRATTHFDLATLKKPQFTAYYCWKHKKICKPQYSMKYWFDRYCKDTLSRLQKFDDIRRFASSIALTGDSRILDIFTEVSKRNSKFFSLLKSNKINGIFSSPPYVGQIDYHEQHAYAYELFRLERNDESEIGPLFKGQGKQARESYVEGISDVLLNCRKYLASDANIFLVANDKHNLYPSIAQRSQMKIVNSFKRPVLNRTERDKSPYAEVIFHLVDMEKM